MHGDHITDLNRKMLSRIVALLYALACVAERSSLRSEAVRWSVLWLLAPGEIVARTYVAAVTGNQSLVGPSAPGTILHAGDGPEEALRLAQAFRMLAAALSALLDSLGEPSKVVTPCAGLALLACTTAFASAAGVQAVAADSFDSS